MNFTNFMNSKIFLFIIVSFFLKNEVISQISVFSDFENGNVELVSVDSALNILTIKPSLINETNTTRCWFYFGITGYDTTKILTISYIYTGSVVAPQNPVYSYDKKKWLRLNATFYENQSKKVSEKFVQDTVYFAAGYPYTYSDILEFVDSIAFNPYVDTATIAISEGGRKIPMITISDKKHNPVDMVWITGRLHAFETTLNYTLEGFINFLISDDKNASKLREKTIIFIVPMADVDNVFIGASGRMQKPIDFNRDWSENPHWIAIKAIQDSIIQTNNRYNYRIFLDFHSTYPGTTQPRFGLFSEYDKDQTEYKNLRNYFNFFEKNAGYELDEIEGQMQANYSDAFSGGFIYPNIKVIDFSTTVECDWTTNHNGNDLTIKELRKVGELLAISLCNYLAD